MIKKEVSAGFVVFYRNKTPKILLILNSKGHWDFPKGHVEKGESLLEAAKRELEEETGIKDIKIYPLFKEKIGYYYSEGGEKRYKDVYFFLGEVKSKEVKLSFEHKNFKWVDCENALKIIKFKEQKNILEKACEYINKTINI